MSSSLPQAQARVLRAGTAIPAIPLALDKNRRFDERRQRALIRYYLDSGSGGIAAGVHTTQFSIREHNLFKPVMMFVSQEIDAWSARGGAPISNGQPALNGAPTPKEAPAPGAMPTLVVAPGAAASAGGASTSGGGAPVFRGAPTSSAAAPVIKIGGICGDTAQAVREAEFLNLHGYHAGLLSLAAMKHESIEHLIAHAMRIADIIPLVGFYLQPAVGGRALPYEFWRAFLEVDNVIAIKVAPFNRYQTLDVVRALADSGREREVTLYTGNDDHIVIDLVTPFSVKDLSGIEKTIRFRGGLLGQWSVWTKRAVELHAELRALAESGSAIPASVLSLAQALTDANAAIFDAAHSFAGCIPGIHEILKRQGLLEGIWCLDPSETLSEGQAEEIDRISAAYPELSDDAFVREHLAEWLA